jgi:hypothetical protein
VLIITGACVLGAFWFAGWVADDLLQGRTPKQFDMTVLVFLVGLLVWRWLNSVRGYELQTGGDAGPTLLIRRGTPWNTVPVPLNRLRSVDPDQTIRGIFSMGLISQGSIFGWAGPSNVPELGSVLAYATSARAPLILEMAPRAELRYRTSDGSEARGPTLVLSPRDPQAMAVALFPFCRTSGGGLGSLLALSESVSAPPPTPRKKRR